MRAEKAKVVDIRAHHCPMTWVRVKLALETIAPGELLEILVKGEEPIRNIPRSAEGEGHTLVGVEGEGEERTVFLRKGGAGC